MSSFDKNLLKLEKSSSDSDIVRLIQNVSQNALYLEEVASLASQLAASGASLPASSCPSADVASTGGPSSLSTLICPLFLRLKGYTVPKLAVPGRPAGGIDVLATIPGYKTNLRCNEVITCLEQCQYAHFLAGEDFVPLDARMFRLRQQVGAQDNPYLATASLISKKLAASVSHARLDVRVGPHGNFGRTIEHARENARMFNSVARMVGLNSGCYLTDASSVYQPFIGRGEALVALDSIFSDQASLWLTEHLRSCWEMTETLQTGVPFPDGRTLRNLFAENLTAQGSNIRSFDLRVEQIRESTKSTVRASSSGFLTLGIKMLRHVLVQAQAIHTTRDTVFSDPCGIELLCRPGQQVEIDQPVARVRGFDIIELIADRENVRITEMISVSPSHESCRTTLGGFDSEWVMEDVK